MRVCHLITSLEVGGAQMIMLGVIARLTAQGHPATVISLTGPGPIADPLRKMGVRVLPFGTAFAVPSPLELARLARVIAETDPDVVQTWLYRADLLGALVRRPGARWPLVWGIHTTSPLQRRRRTAFLARANTLLSHLAPRAIVYCSEDARVAHERIGYARGRARVIPNGVDTERFRPDPEARSAVRKELGLAEATPLIGFVARLDPIKDHATFFAAARALHAQFPGAHFVLCGDRIEPGNPRLAEQVREAGVAHVTHLLGIRHDIPRITAALDIANTVSVSESFSLTLAEAMACGVPCVATDCGGPREILNGLGHLTPVGDAAALCRAWRELLDLPPEAVRERGMAAREHIRRHYSVDCTAAAYLQLYKEIGAPGAEYNSEEVT